MCSSDLAKGVFADPENRLCVYGSEAPVTLPGDQITSITAVTERGDGECPSVREIYDFLDEHCEDVTFAVAESYR